MNWKVGKEAANV